MIKRPTLNCSRFVATSPWCVDHNVPFHTAVKFGATVTRKNCWAFGPDDWYHIHFPFNWFYYSSSKRTYFENNAFKQIKFIRHMVLLSIGSLTWMIYRGRAYVSPVVLRTWLSGFSHIKQGTTWTRSFLVSRSFYSSSELSRTHHCHQYSRTRLRYWFFSPISSVFSPCVVSDPIRNHFFPISQLNWSFLHCSQSRSLWLCSDFNFQVLNIK